MLGASAVIDWTHQVVTVHATAASRWRSEADIPDPLRDADLLARPDLASAALNRRARGGATVGVPRPMTYPKPTGSLRTLVRFDPLADLEYRRAVGRVVPSIEGALDGGVHNARCEQLRGAWRTRSWRRAHRSYEAAVEAARDDDTIAGEVRYDVRSHYGTVAARHLASCLCSTGAPDGAVNEVITFLDQTHDLPGSTPGLPIGPEASAPLGTVALLPVDRRIQGLGGTAYRWMDDGVIPVESRTFGEELLHQVDDQLRIGDQALNPDKSGYFDFEDVPAIGGSAFGSGPQFASSDAALFHLEAATSAHDPSGVTSALGYMRAAGDDRALRVLEQHSWLSERFPRQAARYIKAVSSGNDPWDWVLDLVLAPPGRCNCGQQMHLAGVLPRQVIGASVAHQLFDRAEALDRTGLAPLADQLFATAGRCTGHDSRLRRRALERAMAVGELNEQRALLRVFSSGGIDRRTRAAFRQLEACHPDLAMTVAWIQQ